MSRNSIGRIRAEQFVSGRGSLLVERRVLSIKSNVFAKATLLVCMSGSEPPVSEQPAAAESAPVETGGDESTPSDVEIPPLDVVDSRWWYWIVAYPVVTLLFVPLALILGTIGLAPYIVVSPDPLPQPLLGVAFGLLGLVVGVLLLILVLGSLAVFVMFPVALYMDSRAVSMAEYEWKPDPLLYGILGVVQFIVTPLVGLIVALYYLYQRHEHVGVP